MFSFSSPPWALDMIVWLYSASSFSSLPRRVLLCLPVAMLCDEESERKRKKKRIRQAKGRGLMEFYRKKKNLGERRENSHRAWRQRRGEKISKNLRYFEKLCIYSLQGTEGFQHRSWVILKYDLFRCAPLCSYPVGLHHGVAGVGVLHKLGQGEPAMGQTLYWRSAFPQEQRCPQSCTVTALSRQHRTGAETHEEESQGKTSGTQRCPTHPLLDVHLLQGKILFLGSVL